MMCVSCAILLILRRKGKKRKILKWFEQTFAHLAGDDQLLQLDEFKRALHISGVRETRVMYENAAHAQPHHNIKLYLSKNSSPVYVLLQFVERVFQLMDHENSGKLTIPEILDAFGKVTWWALMHRSTLCGIASIKWAVCYSTSPTHQSLKCLWSIGCTGSHEITKYVTTIISVWNKLACLLFTVNDCVSDDGLHLMHGYSRVLL